MRYLIDTNVITEPGRSQPSRVVLGWLDRTRPTETALSALTIGELRKGAEQLRTKNAERAAALDAWIGETIRDFGDRILGVDAQIAEVWGRLEANRPQPRIDALLAATALVHDLTVVTRNVRDFAGTGVQVLNPFEGGDWRAP